MSESRPAEPESLRVILGGRRGAIDATLPVAAFAIALVVTQLVDVPQPGPVYWAGGVALVVAAAVAAVRLAQGRKPRSVLLGLLGVAVGAAVAFYTGRAVDFFLPQLILNAGSALAWAVSIVIRWPFLGLIVGGILGQRTRWRRDPHLLLGYQRASWAWVGQYLLRLVVFIPLYLLGADVVLAITRIALTWPLIAVCIAVSWPLLRSALPPGHPGIRHPVDPGVVRGTG